MPRILERCWEYNALGVPETWIFDPEAKQAFIAQRPTVTEFKGDLLSCGSIKISLAELFDKL
jgi:Uma2 family endonuclease